MSEAVNVGPQPSARTLDAMLEFKNESEEKSANNQFILMTWEEVKDNTPPQINISLVTEIIRKTREFRVILDLSFKLLLNGF